MNMCSARCELLSLVHLAYGPPDPELGEARHTIVEERVKRWLWQLDEGRKCDGNDAPGVSSGAPSISSPPDGN
jgi:hypothetical protein